MNDMGVMSVKKVYVIDAAGLSTSGGMSNQRVELVNDGLNGCAHHPPRRSRNPPHGHGSGASQA